MDISDLVYAAYRHNRELSPHVEPERWVRVFANDDVPALEERYQRERTCPLCLRKGERMIDGFCWRCHALATDVTEFERLT